MTGEESVEPVAGRRLGLSWWSLLIACFLLPVAVAGVGLATGSSADGDPPIESYSGVMNAESRPPVTLHGQTPEQAELVYEVLDRFSRAGLDLPALTITFWPNRDGCDGLGGRHRGMGEIEICIPTARMIAHEIGHAWDAHNLTDTDREAYRRLWDAPTWGSHEFEWHERAIELAANTVAFAMLNDDPEPYQQILMYLCTFEALADRPLPTPVTSSCPPPRHPGQGSD